MIIADGTNTQKIRKSYKAIKKNVLRHISSNKKYKSKYDTIQKHKKNRGVTTHNNAHKKKDVLQLPKQHMHKRG